MTAPWYRWDGSDLLLKVRVQPRAGHDALGEVHQGRLRVRIGAAPVDGQANARLCRFLAEVFAVAPSRVTCEAGLSARDKRLRIQTPHRLPLGIPLPDDV
jgi:hypothetical protein